MTKYIVKNDYTTESYTTTDRNIARELVATYSMTSRFLWYMVIVHEG